MVIPLNVEWLAISVVKTCRVTFLRTQVQVHDELQSLPLENNLEGSVTETGWRAMHLQKCCQDFSKVRRENGGNKVASLPIEISPCCAKVTQ